MKKIDTKLILSAQDLIGHLNCRHLTALNLGVVNGSQSKPTIWKDPQLEVLWERGRIHEENHLNHLQSQGLEIVKIEGVDITDEAVQRTIAAMAQGKQIIAQAALSFEQWCGRIDVLRRIETPSKLGNWSYEVIDTKLSRETKGGTVLQLCLYSDLLSQFQGKFPDFMHVVMPWSNFEPKSYRFYDYAAYYRNVRASLEEMVSSKKKIETYPDPKEHCDICIWHIDCDKKRRNDDHLCLVAGITKIQTNELVERSHGTTGQLAAMPLPLVWKPERGSAHSYVRLREQARLQVEGQKAKKNIYELLPLEPGFGFYCLPEPSEGDIFLDFEGDPYVGESGLEYLLGYVYKEKTELKYVPNWALNRADEKKIFEDFVNFVMANWKKYPDMHIYHFAAYEPSALKRLMGRYGRCEEEIDGMLRANLFIDLSTITRKCIRASVESYSIKKLEPLYEYTRKIDLRSANLASASLQANLELNSAEAISADDKSKVESYNCDDCKSAYALRDWLESLRKHLIEDGASITRPQIIDGTASEQITEWLKKINALSENLLKDIPALVEDRTSEQQARWLLANILDWHRREEKSTWWEFFRLAALSSEELFDEKAGLSGLSFLNVAGGTDKAPIHRYKFPPQDTDLRGGEELRTIGGNKFGSVEDISFKDYTVDIKKRKDTKDIHPEAVFAHDSIPSKELANSLVRLAEYVVANGMTGIGKFQAARDLLMKESPRLGDEKILQENENPQAAALRISTKLDSGILSIQGPPGTGKTFTGAQMICALVQKGKKVGITANSHKVIRHLLDGVISAAEHMKVDLECVQKPSAPEPDCNRLTFVKSNEDLIKALKGKYQVAGATAWFWSREDAFETVDVLFVDEAAQMSLANVLAVSQAAKAIVLLGDPQQLDQPIQGSHPEGTALSALNHILGEAQTISPEKGLFLEETWRLHPLICAFTSELFYDNKLHSQQGLDKQIIKSSGKIKGAGLCYIPVEHHGNSNCSPEEAAAVQNLVKEILDSKSTWVNYDGKESPIALEKDILIISPYNAQVYEIQQRLPGARVGTVDKFQGQQAAIAIYSMATSSHADAPRGMEFLYSLNRLNVATSRAKCISILVGSPKVFEAECKTPHQMKLANAFCRYLELANT